MSRPTPSSPPSRRHKSFEVTHQALIEASVRLISEKGVESLSIAGLARAVGMNRATVYYHFESREAMRGIPPLAEQGLLDLPYGRDYLAFFPNLFLIGTPTQPFSHTVYPISADRSRGVVRVYWVGDDATASQRFAREYSLAQIRDIHAEDVSMIERGQSGLASGALSQIHFQDMEALCRHLFNEVDERVQDHARRTGASL